MIFQRVGGFGGLELELKKFDISYPKADVVLWFKFDLLDNSAFKVEGTITIHCDDLTKPGGCNVTIDLGKTSKGYYPADQLGLSKEMRASVHFLRRRLAVLAGLRRGLHYSVPVK